MRDFLPANRPLLVLAPMQDVTDLPFMRVMERFGGPDVYVTEYFRVYENSRLKAYILRSIDENPTGKPVFAQMIGQDIPSLVRSARELEEHAVAGIDLNLGCPAPVVCRKDAGGGLLRNPAKVDRILGELRQTVQGRFTVKTRVGYDDPREFEDLLEVFQRHRLDALAIHGRTVRERYQSPVHPDCIRQAVETLPCPVIANGNIVDVATGRAVQEQTGAAGLMLGRGAIRNPWLFNQLRASFGGATISLPVGRDLLAYIEQLWEETAREQCKAYRGDKQVQKMKRYLAYITQGLDPAFDHEILRASEEDEFFRICRRYLSHDNPLPRLPQEASRRFCGFSELLSVSSSYHV
ncbi:MAG: tRNA-dihydrouridine synthase family protein [Roseibacillus sp.]|nr:tRNA-dihydrouridine synthase family protein [Roseibacillus sp.]